MDINNNIKSGMKYVVIGGGTGSFVLLSGLKQYTSQLTALVNMVDDGGSSGQLRDELGVLPPGDIRQCLVALSESPKVRDLFSYRFADGPMKGHAFGNLFLTALEKMSGDFAAAVELASAVLHITGKVVPITLSNINLALKTADGKVTKGEDNVGNTNFSQPRPELWLEPESTINPKAQIAIEEADVLIVAPGNLYGSIAPALIVPGVAEAITASQAKKVYVCNLVTKPGQTDNFGVHDFAAEIERFVGQPFLDFVLYNTHPPSQELLQKYAHDGEYAVAVDDKALKQASYEAVGANLLANGVTQTSGPEDALQRTRTLIRHDSDKVARQIMKISFA